MNDGWLALTAVLEASRGLCELSAPQCFLEDDGEFAIEWDSRRDRTLTVSVSPEGRIGWAGIIGTWIGHGSCKPVPTEELLAVFARLEDELRGNP